MKNTAAAMVLFALVLVASLQVPGVRASQDLTSLLKTITQEKRSEQLNLVHELLHKIDSLEDKLNKIHPKLQYFSVYLSDAKTLPKGQVLIFDSVHSDPESLYDRSSGNFTCKVPGAYEFTLTAISRRLKPPAARVHLGVSLNGDYKIITTAMGNWDQGSNSVTLKLNLGDVVEVKGSGGTSDVHGGPWGPTTFSGKLVTPIMIKDD